jgi:hypothetical protein
MAISDGRGDEKKAAIREVWTLVPVLHTHLLHGHPIRCCCGARVTTTYYRFDATHNISGKRDVLYAHADGCARKLLDIAPAIAPIPLFNPFQTPARGGGGAGGDAAPGQAMDAFNAELYAAIHLTLMCWGRPPSSDGALVNILSDLRRAPHVALPPWTAKSVNTIIGRGRRSLTTMLQALPPQYRPMRTFPFPLMRQALAARRDCPEIWL